MNGPAQSPGKRWAVLTVAVAAAAALVLLGWLLGLKVLTGIFPGGASMNPMTAVGFGLAAAAVWLLGAPGGRRAQAGRTLAGVVVVIGLLRMAEILTGFPSGVDRMLFPGRLARVVPESHMALSTALALSLIGLGAALRDFRWPRGFPITWLTVPAAASIGLFTIVGGLLGGRVLADLPLLRPMSLPAALSTCALAAATLLLRPADPWIDVVSGHTMAGSNARRLLLAAVLVPMALGWARLIGERVGYYNTEFGVALFVTGMVVMFSVVVWVNAFDVGRFELARLEAERLARESERRLFQILEELPVGVFVVDGEGRAYYTNRASREILGQGLRAGALLAELPDVYQAYRAGTEEPYPADAQPIARALAGERAQAHDIEIRHSNRVVPIEVWAAPVRDRDGQVQFAIAAFRDVTEERQAAARIARLNDDLLRSVTELQALNRELDSFTYSVSHDLRAPIRHISGFTRLLGESLGGAVDDRTRHYLARIQAGAQQMGLLIDDLLHLSRVSRQELVVTPVDLNALLRNVADDLREETQDRAIEWRVGSLPRIPCDPGLVRQIFANLLANAVKFTRGRDRAVIEVGHRAENGETVLYVRDNGVGFDMRYADKLFGVFQRLHRPEDFEGTGVGLATVQRIVHKHGGRIWAEAELDKGTAFYFTLEADAGPPGAADS